MSTAALRLRPIGLLAAVFVIGWAPAFVLAAVGYPQWVTPWIYGFVVAFGGALTAPRYLGSLVLGAAVVAGPAVALHGSPVGGAALMAVVAVVMGIASTRKHHSAVSVVGLVTGFLLTGPPADVNPVAVALLVLAGGMWTVLLIRFLMRRADLPDDTEYRSQAQARVYALALVIAIVPATWWALTYQPNQAGGWLLMTLFLIMQPGWNDSVVRSLQRAAGTVVGVIVAGALALLIQQPGLQLALGGVLLFVALVMLLVYRCQYWIFVSVLTPGVVFISSAGSTEQATAEVRLASTLGAVAISLIVAVVLRVLLDLQLKRRGVAPAGREERPEAPRTASST